MNEKKYPFGNPRELEPKADKVAYKKVKAHTIWENNDNSYPIRLGDEKFGLARFLTSYDTDSIDGMLEIDTFAMNNYGRSGLIGRVLFKDRQGRYYRDIVTKGIGFYKTYPFLAVENPSVTQTGWTFGIVDQTAAEEDVELSFQNLKDGIDAPVPIAIYGLDEIVLSGKKISVEQAKTENIINRNAKPVVYLRAFGVNSRFVQLAFPDAAYLWKDAKKFVEESNGSQLSDLEYFLWLVKKQAKNIALMHKNHRVHCSLFWGHNFTLDGKVADFHKYEYTENERLADLRHLNEAFKDLFDRLKKLKFLEQEVKQDIYTSILEKEYQIYYQT